MSQNSHSKCYFSSWTEATWFNKLIFLEKHWLQRSHWILPTQWILGGQGFFQEYRYLFLDFLNFSYLKCLFQGVSLNVLENLMISHFFIIMKVEGLLQGGLRPPWPPAAAQGLSRSRGRGGKHKAKATWFIKCCSLKNFGHKVHIWKAFLAYEPF